MVPPIQWYCVGAVKQDKVRGHVGVREGKEGGTGADLAVYIEQVKAVINGWCLIPDEPRAESANPDVEGRDKDSEEKEALDDVIDN